jgi:uncharacterized protein YqgC (DUF456 family)
MIGVGIWLTPLVGLLAALLVLFAVEWIRIKDHKAAFKSTSQMAMGCGWAVGARLLVAVVMIGLFVMWYFLLYK